MKQPRPLSTQSGHTDRAATQQRATYYSAVIQVKSAEFAQTPALGLMVITLDNAAGTSEAQTIDLQLKK